MAGGHYRGLWPDMESEMKTILLALASASLLVAPVAFSPTPVAAVPHGSSHSGAPSGYRGGYRGAYRGSYGYRGGPGNYGYRGAYRGSYGYRGGPGYYGYYGWPGYGYYYGGCPSYWQWDDYLNRWVWVSDCD